MSRPLFYGWFDQNKKVYRLSKMPPDAPIRPSRSFETLRETLSLIEHRRWQVMWIPPLPKELLSIEFQSVS